MRRGGQRLERAQQRVARLGCAEPVIDDEADKEQRRQERHLIRLHQHQPGRDAGREPVAQRGAIERAREQPQRDREEHEALDLPDVLDAPRRRGAEREGERRHDAARRMPAAVAEEHQHREPAEREQRQHRHVERMEARVRREQRQQHHRREDQRLRIGDLRDAAEHVGRPERRLALMDGVGEELQLGLEQRLGVIGDRHRAGQPRPRQHGPCEQETARSQAIATSGRAPGSPSPFFGKSRGNFRGRNYDFRRGVRGRLEAAARRSDHSTFRLSLRISADHFASSWSMSAAYSSGRRGQRIAALGLRCASSSRRCRRACAVRH